MDVGGRLSPGPLLPVTPVGGALVLTLGLPTGSATEVVVPPGREGGRAGVLGASISVGSGGAADDTDGKVGALGGEITGVVVLVDFGGASGRTSRGSIISCRTLTVVLGLRGR